MRISIASLALAAALAAPVITMASSPAAERHLSPEQSKALFQARKTWAKDSYQRRQELLQSQQRCIDAAASADALKACRREMKKARKSLKQDYRAHMNKVRNQLGLPARTGKKRDAMGRKSRVRGTDQAASRAATPGSTLPSSSSRLAPPPVEM